MKLISWIGFKMIFEHFAIQPWVQQLEKCCKDDLFAVVDLYQLVVPQSEVVYLRKCLWGIWWKMGSCEWGEWVSMWCKWTTVVCEWGRRAKESQRSFSIDPAELPTLQNPLLSIKLKELEFELNWQQYQSQLSNLKPGEQAHFFALQIRLQLLRNSRIQFW